MIDVTFPTVATLSLTFAQGSGLTVTSPAVATLAAEPQSVALYMMGTWPEISGSGIYTFVADGTLSGHRVVKPTTSGKVGYVSSAVPADAPKALGITLGAAVDGDQLQVQTFGVMEEPTWAWTVNSPVYCGVDGVLTQVVPSEGFVLCVGVALKATSINISFKTPIILL